ncbi:MAG: hypothetical protein FWJ92_12045 [Actinomycetes bacterium]|jgi:hypothetical protein|nr:hypothetical protein [Acidimicrobiia bacterium]
MVSPHLLRPYSSRQLSLLSGDGQVMVFAVLGGRYAGPTVLVHHPTLLHRMDTLPRHIRTVVFIDEPIPDAATVALVDDMVELFEQLDVDALAQHVPASEAVKRVRGSRILEGVDRSTLAAVRSPEVIRREALERAVYSTAEQWVSPTHLVALSGGSVRFAGPGAVVVTPA